MKNHAMSFASLTRLSQPCISHIENSVGSNRLTKFLGVLTPKTKWHHDARNLQLHFDSVLTKGLTEKTEVTQ